METKSWREIYEEWIEDRTDGDGWIVMGLIGLSGAGIYGFGLLPIPSLFAWLF